MNRTLIDELTDDDRASYIPDLREEEELRVGHPELLNSCEDLLDIQSENEVEDYNSSHFYSQLISSF